MQKQVTKEEFFERVGKLDVVVSIANSTYPYTSNFETRRGELVGRIVGRLENPAEAAQDFFLEVSPNA